MFYLTGPQAFKLMCVVGFIVVGLAVLAVNTAHANSGYECFNLEISRAQLSHARSIKDKPMIRQARKAVRQWTLLCKQPI